MPLLPDAGLFTRDVRFSPAVESGDKADAVRTLLAEEIAHRATDP